MESYQIGEGAGLYYLTFTVVAWLPVFVAEEPCLLITDSLNHCHRHMLQTKFCIELARIYANYLALLNKNSR